MLFVLITMFFVQDNSYFSYHTNTVCGTTLVKAVTNEAVLNDTNCQIPEAFPSAEGLQSTDFTATQLWFDTVSSSIMEQVVISSGVNKAFVSLCSNTTEASLYDMNGSGTPEWTWAFDPDTTLWMYNSLSASNTDVFAAVEIGYGAQVSIWDDQLDPVPDYSHEGSSLVAVSKDGTRIVWMQTDYTLHCIDQLSQLELWSTSYPLDTAGERVDAKISADGSRMLICVPFLYSKLAVIDMEDGTLVGELFTTGLSTTGTAGISGDASRVVQGSVDGKLHFWEFSGSTWELSYSLQIGQSIVTAAAISEDGYTVAAGGASYSSGYQSKLFCISWPDSSPPSVLWEHSDYADFIWSIDLSAGGDVIAVACWGGCDFTQGDVFTLLDKSGNIITHLLDDIDVTGSMLWVDISPDGEWVCCSGTPEHNRNWHTGGYVYAFQICSSQGIEQADPPLIAVSPNPVALELHLDGCKTGTQYTVYDTTGRQVLSGTSTDSPISVNALSTGVYMIQLNHTTGRSNVRFTIIR